MRLFVGIFAMGGGWGRCLGNIAPGPSVHFAAESHVDRSIASPEAFIRTNVQGTFVLLEQAKKYWAQLNDADRAAFRFLHVSTDEVYGTLGPDDPAFSETTAYAPNSPYAASKAASDHLVRSYHHTFGLPVLTTNCSNNYGPFQFPEKLIPLMILNALEGKALPVYGDGKNVRDWLFVEDHCSAIRAVLERGRIGETYNIGGNSERANIEVVTTICDLVDEMRPQPGAAQRRKLITYVADRPGHDRRYAIDAARYSLSWDGSRPNLRYRPAEHGAVVSGASGLGGAGYHRRLPRVDRSELCPPRRPLAMMARKIVNGPLFFGGRARGKHVRSRSGVREN